MSGESKAFIGSSVRLCFNTVLRRLDYTVTHRVTFTATLQSSLDWPHREVFGLNVLDETAD